MAKGLWMVKGNKRLFLKLLVDYRKDYRGICQRLEKLQKAGDTETLERLAHTIKGMAGTLGEVVGSLFIGFSYLLAFYIFN